MRLISSAGSEDQSTNAMVVGTIEVTDSSFRQTKKNADGEGIQLIQAAAANPSSWKVKGVRTFTGATFITSWEMTENRTKMVPCSCKWTVR